MARFGENLAPQELNDNDVSGIRRKPDIADEGYARVREDEFIEDEPLKRGRKSPPPSRAQARRKQKQVAEAPVISDEEVKNLPEAKRVKFVSKEGKMPRSTPESRARFGAERAGEREEFKRYMEKKEQERQELLKQLEALEHRILETGEAADSIKAERERIEAESREEQEAIKREAMERVEASAAARDIMNEPMEGVARQMGREQALADRMKEGEEIESQLEVNEKGHVTGFKNIPYIDAGSVHLALPAMWRRNDSERSWLNKNKLPGWERLMKELDIQAEHMTTMRELADELINQNRRDVKVLNLFYRSEAGVAMRGVEQTKAETLLALPENVLEERERQLGKENEAINSALEEFENISRQIDAFIAKKQKELDAKHIRLEIRERDIGILSDKLKNLQAEHDQNHKMQQPEYLDMHGKRLQFAYDRAKAKIEAKKRELSTSKGDGEKRKGILVEIGEYEFEASEVQKRLAEWREDPVRARAMGYRLEALQDEAKKLSREIMFTQEFLRIAKEGKERDEHEADMIVRDFDNKFLGGTTDLVDEKMQSLLREKARVEGELSSVRRARIMREAPPRGDEIDVDVMDATDDGEELDIDVDTSDFEDESEKRKAA